MLPIVLLLSGPEKSHPNIGNLTLILFLLVVVYDDTDTDDDQYCQNETKRSHQITEDQRKIVSNNFWLYKSVLGSEVLPLLNPVARTCYTLCSVPPGGEYYQPLTS